MAESAATLLLGVVLFIATNVDDIFILLALFADRGLRSGEVVLGQYLGIGAIVVVSVVAALIALVIPSAYVGLLGLAPIAIGIKKLLELRGSETQGDDASELEPRAGRFGNLLAVAAITIANGGDNIAVYTPVFAVRSAGEIVGIVAVFLVMTSAWCAIAHWLVNHPTIGAPIKRYSRPVLPFVLIGLGALVLHEAGTLELLPSLRG